MTGHLRPLSLACVAIAMTALGCGRRELVPPYVFPLAPTGPFTGARPANLRQLGGYFIAFDKTAFAAQVTWDAVQGAWTYVVEVGDTPGGSNLLVTEFAATSQATIIKLPFFGSAFVRVRAKSGATVGQPSTELSLASADFRDYVEALFFGTGALGGAGSVSSTCPAPTGGLMRGWPRGPAVQVLFGVGVDSGQQATVQRMVAQFADASGASVTFQDSPELAPPASINRLIVATVPDDQVERACGNVSTDVCFSHLSFAPFQMRYLIKSSLTGHRLGFFTGWAFGLCFVQIPGWSVMSGFTDVPEELTEGDIRALRAVYGAGLGHGSPLSAFVAAGLIRP